MENKMLDAGMKVENKNGVCMIDQSAVNALQTV